MLCACGSEPRAAPLLAQRVLAAAGDRVDAGEYPALVIGYIDHGHRAVYAFGKLESGAMPNADTIFEIGSITKTFTASLLAKAVLSGDLKLEDSVSKVAPSLKLPERNGRSITLLDLATQYSGLPRLPNNFIPLDPANPYADYSATQLRAFLAGYTLPREPGQSFEYSNLGFGLLGFALAEHGHASYPALVGSEITRPLGMDSTGASLTPDMSNRLAVGHGEDGAAVKNWDFDALAGAGALRSTVNDMLRYLEVNMAEPKSAFALAMKLAQRPRLDAGPRERIGLAWLTRIGKNGNIVWHNGGTGGYRSFVGFAADGERGIVILTNSSASVDDLGFAALLDDEPLRPSHRTVLLTDTMLDEYVGTYQLSEHFLIDILRQGHQLLAQATHQGAFAVFPSAPDEFFARVADIAISFTRNVQGKVIAMIIHQHGDRRAKKLTNEEAALANGGVALDTTVLKGLLGRYKLAPGNVLDVTLDAGQLKAQLTGQPPFPIYAKAMDEFFYSVVDAQISFERNHQGEVTALVLHQNGQDQRAVRDLQ